MYLALAAVVALAVLVVLWRRLGENAQQNAERSERPFPKPRLPHRKPPTRILAPDDDPEFLRELRRKMDDRGSRDPDGE